MKLMGVIAWVLLVLTLIFLILFLLSVPSIDEYCMHDKKAFFGINIWKNASCIDYWREVEQADYINYIQETYNISIG